jgi:hypothetical protein
MRTMANKFFRFLSIGFILAMMILLPAQSFASQRWQHGDVYDRDRGAVRVITTRDGRRIVYRRIDGRWIMVRTERNHDWYWMRYHHRRMGDLYYRPRS